MQSCTVADDTPTPPFYVYVIYDPRPGKDDVPVYVGKGKGRRAYAHLRGDSCKPALLDFIAHCRKHGNEPRAEIMARFPDEADAFAFEMERIAKYGRRDLGTGTLFSQVHRRR
jgi:hypothetical protein